MKTDKIKILFITDAFVSMGGAEKNIVTLSTNLNKMGYIPFVCCLKGGRIKSLLEQEGIAVIDLYLKKIYNYQGIRTFLSLLTCIKKEQIQLVLTYHESSDLFGFFIKIFTGIPILSTRRDMGYKLLKRHIAAYKLINNFFDKIITVSHSVKSIIMERENVPSTRIVTIHNGIDVSLYSTKVNHQSLKTSLGINPLDKIVAVIGGMRKIKDHNTFIIAASMIVKTFSNVKFLLVGADKLEKDFSFKDIEHLSNQLGIRRYIIYPGMRTDISDMLSIIDISVLPSLSEGFSNTILESMAAGKPVIATNVGGNQEAIISGLTGILVPPQDPHALAHAIMKLLANKELACKMGHEGKLRVESLFSLPVMLDKYTSLFQSTLNTSRGKVS